MCTIHISHIHTQARNKCQHGVTAEHGNRISITMRLGIHSEEFWTEECAQYWD